MADKEWKDINTIRMETGERIRMERESIGMNRQQLAERIGVTERTITNIETGEHGTTIYRMIAISDVLNSSLDYLLKGERDGITKSDEEEIAAQTVEFIKRSLIKHKLI